MDSSTCVASWLKVKLRHQATTLAAMLKASLMEQSQSAASQASSSRLLAAPRRCTPVGFCAVKSQPQNMQ